MHFPHPDIKIGETYNLRIHVIGKSEDFIIARPITQNGGYATSSLLEILHKYAPSFTPIHSEHGTSLSRRSSVGAETEVPTPKHSPTRLFKKGDKVRVVKLNGRTCNLLDIDKEYILASDEDSFGLVAVRKEPGIPINLSFYWLELIIPVEELEPFYLDEITVEDEDGEPFHCFMIKTLKGEDRVRTYYSNKFETIEQTKAAAEAERDRLNAEWRKEQK